MNAQRAVVLACWPAADPLLAGIGSDAALLELAGKPLAQRVVEQAVALGATRIDVVLGDSATPYQVRLGDGRRWGCTIAYHYAPDGACLPRQLARQLEGEDDCLLLMADAMLPAGFRPQPATFGGPTAEGELTWAGWARLRGRDLVAAVARATSPRVVFLALCRNRGLRRCREPGGPAAVGAAALLDAARSLLREPDYPIGIARRPAAAGLWIGNGARIHPTARVKPPAWIGDHVLVAAGAVIGPDAVIGAGSIVDRDSTVAGSIVVPGSYVGAGVELREGILAGRRLVNVVFGAALEVTDRELAGPAAGPDGPRGPGLAERLLAFGLWALSWPVAKAAAGRRVGRVADGEAVPADLGAAMRSGACGAWVRHFRDVFHPGLAEVAAGRRRIIGPRPLAGATSSSSMPPASGSACGLINDALFLGPDGADPAIGYAADVLSAKPQSIGTVFRGVLRYADAVAKDWQASAAARGASRVAAGTNP